MSTPLLNSTSAAPSDVGFWSWELDTRLVRYSPAWAHMVGETLESLGKRLDGWLVRVFPDDRPALLEQLKACALGRHQTLELTYRMLHRDGSVIHLSGHVEVATRRADGRALRIVGDQRLAPVAAPSGADVRLISSASSAAAAIQQLQNEFIHQADERKLFDSLLQELLAFSGSEFGFIGEVRDADTPAPWLRVTSITNIAWDEASRNFYARHHSAGLEFRNVDTLFGAAMLSKRPVLSNDPPADPRRGGLPHGHPPLKAFAGIPVFSASKMIGLIGLANREGGYDEAFLEAVRPLTDGVSSLMRAWQLVQSREESERARSAAELSSRAKSQFLSRMSHELRTPMHAMLGFAQLLEQDRNPPLSAQQRRHVSHVLSAGWHLLGMIDDMLDLARIEAGKLSLNMESTSIGQAVADSVAIVSPLLEEHSVRLTNNVRIDSPVRVQADPRRLRQILINLLSNAAKYNRPGGTIIVDTTTAVDGQVSLSVRDTGIGIAPERLRTLYTPFDRLGAEQSSTEGTGIGLVITNHLTEMMGGRVVVASTLGQGSVFTVSLPPGQAASVAETPERGPAQILNGAWNNHAAPATDIDGARDSDATVPMSRDMVAATLGRRSIVERAVEGRTDRMLGALQAEPTLIVYVEDNALNARLLRLMMASRPQVRIEVAINGHDGIEMVRTLAPRLVLVDLNLPDMHGLDLLGKLRADPSTRDIPCIAVSADALPLQIESALSSGFVDYLVKPLKVDDLLSRIDRWVGKRVVEANAGSGAAAQLSAQEQAQA